MGFATYCAVVPGTNHQSDQRRLALHPLDISYLRERPSCSSAISRDVRGDGESHGGEMQLRSFTAPEPARDASSEDL